MALRVASQVQPSPLLDRILENIGTDSVGSLSTIETTSHQTFNRLLQPGYVRLFHFLTTLKAATRTTPDSVDLLPHLMRIETLDLTNISLPPYADDVDLPLIHSLHHLRLKAVSIQWIGGRKFPRLQSCSIHSPTIYPPLSSDVYLPLCEELELGHRSVEVAGRFQAPKVYSMTMKSNEWTPLRGSKQVILLCRAGLGFHWQPGVLHLSVLCDERLLLSVLKLLPALNELRLDIARPCVLGRRFFKALLAKPTYDPKGGVDRNWDEDQPKHVEKWESSICPSLRRLVLKYERWLRQTDRLDILPPLMAIGWSRSETTTPLESFDLCFKRSDIKWEVLNLDSGRNVLDFAALDIHQLMPFQGFSSFFKSCVLATASSVMVHIDEKSEGLPEHLQHTLPIFEPYFSQLTVLRIHSPHVNKSTLTILPNFFRLEELALSSINIPYYSINASLPLFKTLLRLSLGTMSLSWMNQYAFTRLKRLLLDQVSFGESLSVRLPVCTHIKYVSHDHWPLQSIFHVPTLIELVKYPSSTRNAHELGLLPARNTHALQLLPTRTLLLRRCNSTTPESLVAGIASLVELEVLDIETDRPILAIALLTALGKTIVEIALGSTYVTLGRIDAVGRLICPNLRQFTLHMNGAGPLVWQQIENERKQMMDTRRRAGQGLEWCRVWWDRRTGAQHPR